MDPEASAVDVLSVTYRSNLDGFKSCNCGFSCNTDPYFTAPLVPGKQILDEAVKGGYGVGAYNVNNMEQIQAIMAAAKDTQSPVIIQASRGALDMLFGNQAGGDEPAKPAPPSLLDDLFKK